MFNFIKTFNRFKHLQLLSCLLSMDAQTLLSFSKWYDSGSEPDGKFIKTLKYFKAQSTNNYICFISTVLSLEYRCYIYYCILYYHEIQVPRFVKMSYLLIIAANDQELAAGTPCDRLYAERPLISTVGRQQTAIQRIQQDFILRE